MVSFCFACLFFLNYLQSKTELKVVKLRRKKSGTMATFVYSMISWYLAVLCVHIRVQTKDT